MNTELIPCPLCGDADGPTYYPAESRNVYGYIRCDNCGLYISDNIGDGGVGTSIVRWNTRSAQPAASILGRKGGKSKSRAKAAAAKKNGKKGGRPKKKPD